MRNKFILGAALVGALFSQANACSISQWSTTDSVGVVAADAAEPTTAGFRRYSARCGLRVIGAATAKYVQDNSPAGATTYKARFYVYSGDGAANPVDTGAAGWVYLARNATGGDLIRVGIVGGNLTTTVANGGAVANIPLTAQRWYSVELDWQNAAGTFTVKVQGAGSATAATQTTPLTASTAVLQNVRLGMSAGATGTAFFDEYDSRRTTAPGRLLNCDANNDGAFTIADRIQINNELLGISLVVGQPDANEDGFMTIADRIQVNNKLLGSTTTCN